MSISTNDIRKKIQATENMSKITKAMQMVSVAKLMKTENKARHFNAYYDEIKSMLNQLPENDSLKNHYFLKASPEKKVGYILLTSNRGLVGGYNNTLFKLMREKATDAARYYVSGQKGYLFARNAFPKDKTITYPVSDELAFTDILELSKQVISDYREGIITEVQVVYQAFISKIQQEPMMKQLLPLTIDRTDEKPVNFEIEPNEKQVLANVLLQYIMADLFHMFLESSLSEHASRMNAMSNATDNAQEIIEESKLLYNRARQAAITQELNEIIAGANAVN